MTRFVVSRPNLLFSFLVLTACGGPGIGPVVTEPMPDIPETVEYDTVRIEYGDDDLIEANNNTASMLVGDPSGIAGIAQGFVAGTNIIIATQIAFVEALMDARPTDYDDGVWTWTNLANRGFAEQYYRFRITRLDDSDFTYQLEIGKTRESLLEVFSGEFRPRQRFNGRQRGMGILRYNFTNFAEVDPTANPSQGRVVIAFRAIGGVRQVRVASFDLLEAGQIEPGSAQWDYIEFPNDAGRFRFAAETDFLNDNAPLEELSIDTVWSRDQAGRALASLTGGSLDINEVLLHECWDESARTTFADATPDLEDVPYEDGTEDDCDAQLLEFDLSPPESAIPQTDPEIPPPHPDEEEEIIVEDE